VALSPGPRVALLEEQFPSSSPDAILRIPWALALKYDVLAYAFDDGTLSVIVPDASDQGTLDRIRDLTGFRVTAQSAPVHLIRRRLAEIYTESAGGPRERERGGDPPAIRSIDEIHAEALKARASDIHIEPAPGGGRIRHRVDGLLFEMRRMPHALFGQIVSRVKLLGGMDIADKRQPQDGRYTIESGEKIIDARVSSMPTIAGEKVVIRLLDTQSRVPTLESLGMEAGVLTRFRALAHAPHGFVVVCGPTGSGKTTTVYSALAERNTEAEHVCTIEDPVELQIEGLAQVQVNGKAGLTFASALRSLLRQDPNVIMVGEMRDGETAQVGVSAALSGQLVMTTLHANDAPRTIERLTELGIRRHAISAALSCVLAQRLVRRLCAQCRRPVRIAQRDAGLFGIDGEAIVYQAVGCELCRNVGYRGRTGIFELLVVDDQVRAAIASGEPAGSIERLSSQSGYQPMTFDATRRVLTGDTSLEELRRVFSQRDALA
jgi:type II secretory ATPase GspE/PulE/Tfp pilus assembly ATPase PilB-like protein